LDFDSPFALKMSIWTCTSIMTAHTLIETLPDLIVLVRRDGIILEYAGGRGVAALMLQSGDTGKHLDMVWPPLVVTIIKQLARRAIAERKAVETSFENAGQAYEVRATAPGPDRAICVIRPVLATGRLDDVLASTGELRRPQLDRRGFLRRFQETLSMAAMQERPVAVAVVYLDGIADIARVVDAKVSEQVLSTALLRLPLESSREAAGQSAWYLGQLSEALLAIVIETSDRDAIETCVSQMCASLSEPVGIGDAAFRLTPYAGVAILGQDATSPRSLLDHARSAATEARHASSAEVSFFTDTLKLRSLARLDIAHEMRDAIAGGDIHLRYIGRHDLATGRLLTRVAYLQWQHPLRGEIRPTEFLAVAETTGLATALSRTAMQGLRDDFAATARLDPDARISFGPLRQHIMHDDFVGDIGRLLAEGAVAAARLELRISERTFVALSPSILKALSRLGIRLVVDEMGRGLGSMDKLARAPIYGLQLDRAWVTALQSDEVALKVCRAGISAATALGLVPIATGVDDEEQRAALLALGFGQGSGDLYLDADRQFDTWVMRQKSH
jgi:EAL domain-containing protein (putative c-di-GMP-specific phosphodiesterase class I)/GGDEF domain-containing protein